MGRLYAISDIHGCFDTFNNLIVNKIRLKKADRLILLGDYIDRGEKSREVIDLILDLSKKGFNITALMGNHESMLLDAYHDRNMMPLWLYNNGVDTLHSFGISDLSELDNRYIDFFENLMYYAEEGNFYFVHAGFDDESADPLSDHYKMIWETRQNYNHPFFVDKTIIHGHRPKKLDFVMQLIRENSRVLPIDTGCVYSSEAGYGFLSALEVNSMQLISVCNY